MPQPKTPPGKTKLEVNGKQILSNESDDGLGAKPFKFTFEIKMTSHSGNTENQMTGLVFEEPAVTGGELTLKQMTFTKKVIPEVVNLAMTKIIEWADEVSMQWQEQGMEDSAAIFEAVNEATKEHLENIIDG